MQSAVWYAIYCRMVSSTKAYGEEDSVTWREEYHFGSTVKLIESKVKST